MTVSNRLFSSMLLVLAMMISFFAQASSDNAVAEKNKDFISQAFAKWATGGSTFFQDVLAEDVVWTIKGTSPAAGTYKGRAVFIEQAVAPFAARLSSFVKPRVNDIWADGNDVVVYWDGSAVAVDGKPYNNSFVWILRMQDLRATEVIAFLDLTQYDDVINRISLAESIVKPGDKPMSAQHSYVGIWVTADGRIRQQLLANGRYDEARGHKESAYQGRYEVKGSQIDYWDDTGFTAEGVFVDQNTLHHGGMIFYRQQ
ncbi:Atu4866 domain-containing protein [Rheinheimera soli]|uniref:Ketosteroid isomerase-like protein n=1 Tax=Rheinheimera soli TaxID=443616 RepID=A0ABU1W5N2_9GAMM|nr:Atu4866 domain-containing protein [Rheinheimera soli]MDR7123033.1 ketosteroid isomerase-like protein [Rheinheimera soli]